MTNRNRFLNFGFRISDFGFAGAGNGHVASGWLPAIERRNSEISPAHPWVSLELSLLQSSDTCHPERAKRVEGSPEVGECRYFSLSPASGDPSTRSGLRPPLASNDIGGTVRLRRTKPASSLSLSLSVSLSNGRIGTGHIDSDCDSDSDSDFRPASRCHFSYCRPEGPWKARVDSSPIFQEAQFLVLSFEFPAVSSLRNPRGGCPHPHRGYLRGAGAGAGADRGWRTLW